MSEKCSICGKEFDVLYPDIYTYKRGKHWFCRYTCMRQYDKERMTKPMDDTIVKRDRKEVLMAIIEAVKDGKTVDEYLVSAGYKKPGEYYHNLRAWAKKNWPDLYEQMPDRKLKKRGPKPKSDKVRVLNGTEYEKAEPEEPATLGDAMEGMKAAADGFFGQCRAMGLNIPEALPTVLDDDFEASVLLSKKTGARYEVFKGSLCMKIGNDEFVLSPETWRDLLKEIPKASRRLGVEL
jgi:hypothetical protein